MMNESGSTIESPSSVINVIKPGILKRALQNYPRTNQNEGVVQRLRNKLSPEMLRNIPKTDYLIVFGGGVQDRYSHANPDTTKKVDTEPSIHMLLNVCAAGELYLLGATKKIILSGGHTFGDINPSEARVMADILIQKYKIPEKDIILEDQSKNTLDNIAFSLNIIDDNNPNEFNKSIIGVIGPDIQLGRIRILAQLLGVPQSIPYSPEELFKLVARLTNNQELMQLLENRSDMNQDLTDSRFGESEYLQFLTLSAEQQSKLPSRSLRSSGAPTYYEKQVGNEAEGIVNRRVNQAFLIKGVLEVPDFWIGFLAKLNDKRLQFALSRINALVPNLLQQMNIVPTDSIANIRATLMPYTVSRAFGGKRPRLEDDDIFNFDVNAGPAEVRQNRKTLANKKYSELVGNILERIVAANIEGTHQLLKQLAKKK